MNEETIIKVVSTLIVNTLTILSVFFSIQFFLMLSKSTLDSVCLVALAVALESMKYLSFILIKKYYKSGCIYMSMLVGFIGMILLSLSIYASYNYLNSRFINIDDTNKYETLDKQVKEDELNTISRSINDDRQLKEFYLKNGQITKSINIENNILNKQKQLNEKLAMLTATKRAGENNPSISNDYRFILIIMMSIIPDLATIILLFYLSMTAKINNSNNDDDHTNDNQPIYVNDTIDRTFMNRVRAKINLGVYSSNINEISKAEKKSKAVIEEVLKCIQQEKPLQIPQNMLESNG